MQHMIGCILISISRESEHTVNSRADFEPQWQVKIDVVDNPRFEILKKIYNYCDFILQFKTYTQVKPKLRSSDANFFI